ncbi:MAG TPA: DUF2182 domain-containing protein [Burkholderiales bacterium]|nr:DUF2182 domain-containing protein [Burkholderiales bacterium]
MIVAAQALPLPRARDRVAVLGVLAGLAALSWAYMFYMEWGMRRMEFGAYMAIMPAMTDWGFADLCLVWLMWAMMMTAMMLPSAVPMALAYLGIRRARGGAARPIVTTSLLIAGYLAVWIAFSIAASLLQWALLEAALITPMMDSASTILSGSLLIGAGVFQFTSLKRACLTGCRSPVQFLLNAWQDGLLGPFATGWKNGTVCLGCCWALMLLPLALGVMNLLWMAALTGFLLVEKAFPRGDWVGRIAGFALISWGSAVLATHLVS